MIAYDGSGHRYSSIIRDRATTSTDRSRHAIAAGDRSGVHFHGEAKTTEYAAVYLDCAGEVYVF